MSTLHCIALRLHYGPNAQPIVNTWASIAACIAVCSATLSRSSAAAVILMESRRYIIFDAETGEQTQLPAIGKETPPAMAVLPSGEVVLSLDGQSQVFGGSGSWSELERPQQQQCQQRFRCSCNELRIFWTEQQVWQSKSKLGVSCARAGRDGKAMKRVLQWSAPPAALAFSQPHLLALLPSGVEARATTCTRSNHFTDGGIFACCCGSVLRMSGCMCMRTFHNGRALSPRVQAHLMC